MFRYSNNWLIYRVKNQIKTNHPDLINSHFVDLLDWVFEKITMPKNWWLVFLFTLLIFLISVVVDIDLFSIIPISEDLSNAILDQRTSNLAIIISITLVVVGFLINNLAVKEAYTFRLLFKYTFLYPIFYFCLSVIGCFFFLSAIREMLLLETFIDLILIGTYLSILILILIGFLFSVLIKFSDENSIYKLMNKELLSEAKENLLNRLYVEYSGKIYKECLENCGANAYDFIENIDIRDVVFGKSKNPKRSSISENYFYLNDLKIGKIEKIIKKRLKRKPKEQIKFKMIRVGDYILKSDTHVWQSPTKDTFLELEIKKHFKIGNKSKRLDSREEVKNYFQIKLKESIKNNKPQEVQRILDSFKELYSLEMKNSDII